MTRVKVIGAGSIGNHLAHAARTLGWAVDLCDSDPRALARTKQQIYPARYGAWDAAIGLFAVADAPRGGYDLICVGTPPDSHMAVARVAVDERPRAVLVEKPACPPALDGAQDLVDAARAGGVAAFVGYDHVVAPSVAHVEAVIGEGLGDVETVDVEFREHWGGIFAAHPWLAGPSDSYLGYWRRGGGACGEHSHALNLWQHLAHCLGAGRVTEVQATLDYQNGAAAGEPVDYDRLCFATLRTETGLVGRVAQDVVTSPPRKWARIEAAAGAVEWHCNAAPGEDVVRLPRCGEAAGERRFAKSRPDDFIQELRHIDACLADGAASPICLERGLDTALVIAAAHASAAKQRPVRIDYEAGYRAAALAAA